MNSRVFRAEHSSDPGPDPTINQHERHMEYNSDMANTAIYIIMACNVLTAGVVLGAAVVWAML